MKRTYWLIERTKDPAYAGWKAERKITCEVTGEMSNGVKVWTELKTGNQYFCMRLLGTYYFYSI